jgi:hypothetical protein
VELERLERELWLWSWNGWSAHEKVRTLLHFLACLLALLQRCFVATQQAPEPGSGACCVLLCCALLCRNAASSGALLRVALLRVALLRVALLRVALLRLALLRLAPELYCALLCCGSGALLRVALLWLRSFAARCFAATKP